MKFLKERRADMLGAARLLKHHVELGSPVMEQGTILELEVLLGQIEDKLLKRKIELARGCE